MNRRRLEAEAVRDAVLSVAGKLDLTMYGPGFQDFVIEQPEHSPHYEYHLHDPEDPRAHRERIGMFAALAAEPYEAGRVKPHEKTHAGPKADRLALLRATRTSLESTRSTMSCAPSLSRRRQHDPGRPNSLHQLFSRIPRH
jgi:hypothetical protein